jgi:hypothetical protein
MTRQDMPLMDKVHAWTFATKVDGIKVNPAAADVQRTLRAKLKAAERFSLDDDAVRPITQLDCDQVRLVTAARALDRAAREASVDEDRP